MTDAVVKTYFEGTIPRDLLRLICGEEIGSGIGRTVYECTIRPDLVVKIETPAGSFQNVLEWEFWRAWEFDKGMKRWLAPCEAISQCGTILLQQRTTPIPQARLPAKMPKFLTDTKISNFGLWKNRVVCHDYGMVVSEASTALRKVEWW